MHARRRRRLRTGLHRRARVARRSGRSGAGQRHTRDPHRPGASPAGPAAGGCARAAGAPALCVVRSLRQPRPDPMTNPMTSPAPQPALRPAWRFLLAHPAHCIALGFGDRLAPKGPGTIGTLWAWLAYLVLQQWLSQRQIGLLIAASTVAGWWASTPPASHLRVTEPGCIVWE